MAEPAAGAKRPAHEKAARPNTASKGRSTTDGIRKEKEQTVLARLERLEEKVDALLRHEYVDVTQLSYPHRLLAQRFPVYSQHGEDGITHALLHEVGMATRTFAEIGCGTNGGNSGFLARELGFRGLMVDASRREHSVAHRIFASPTVAVVRAFVTAENVNDLLEEHGLVSEVDFLSIDIDGNDLWVWHAIRCCAPRIVVIEFNPTWGPDRAVTIPYDPEFRREKQEPRAALRNQYYGASLRALVALGEHKGYHLVCVEPHGVNAYFVVNDVAPNIPAIDPRQAYRSNKKTERLVSEGLDLYGAIEAHGLGLVDLDRDALPQLSEIASP